MSRPRSMNGDQRRSRIRRLVERDGCRCWICDEPIDLALDPGDARARSLDHIHPWSLRGSNDLSNLRLAHRDCNTARDREPLMAVA
jgi:5-methylcytosine-specific restriction endonuclease McrA